MDILYTDLLMNVMPHSGISAWVSDKYKKKSDPNKGPLHPRTDII